jgi:hypothetical protein
VTSAILCPDVTIPNGNISTTNGLRVGSIISYKCQEGYTIEGSDAATCTNDGVLLFTIILWRKEGMTWYFEKNEQAEICVGGDTMT